MTYEPNFFLMELIFTMQSNFRAARNVTVTPAEREKQYSARFKVLIVFFLCFWEICKMKGFSLSWDISLTSCDHPNSYSVLQQHFTSEEALKTFCSLHQIRIPVLYSGLLLLRLSRLIPRFNCKKKVSSKIKITININRKDTVLSKWIAWFS